MNINFNVKSTKLPQVSCQNRKKPRPMKRDLIAYGTREDSDQNAKMRRLIKAYNVFLYLIIIFRLSVLEVLFFSEGSKKVCKVTCL